MIKKVNIHRKMMNLDKYLSELVLLSRRSIEEYLEDFELRRAVERLIQVIVDALIDCNTLLLVGLGERPPIDYKESFLNLGKLKVISTQFASDLVPLTSLRNRIVHEYEEIDNKLVYASIKILLKDMKRYMSAITKYIAKM